MPTSREFAQSVVTVDDRYAPILITHWVGRADLEAAKWATESIDAAVARMAARGQRAVLISEATRSKNPPAAVRKYFAEQATISMEKQRGTVIAMYVVIDNTIVRGALTAIGWMSETVRAMTPVPTLSEALQQALYELDLNGVPRPLMSAESYRPIDPGAKVG